MPYTDLNAIQNVTVNIPVQEAWFDGARANDEYFARNHPYAHCTNSIAISIANSTLLVITLDTERDDNAGSHSLVSNTSRYTAVDAGVYAGGGNVSIAPNATGIRQLLFRLNGSVVVGQITLPNAGAGSSTELASPFQVRLAAGDYLEMCVFQNSGGALNLQASAQWTPEFWWEWRLL